MSSQSDSQRSYQVDSESRVKYCPDGEHAFCDFGPVNPQSSGKTMPATCLFCPAVQSENEQR